VIHSTPGLTGIVLDFGGIDFIDSQGSAKLGDVVHLAKESDIVLRLAGVKPDVSSILGRDGILDRLGTDKIHGSVHRAVQAHLDASPPSTDGISRE